VMKERIGGVRRSDLQFGWHAPKMSLIRSEVGIQGERVWMDGRGKS
jgi:hypothetical protein